MHYFCTYFDSKYLIHGLALHESLKRHCPEFRLWVLCLDQITYDRIREKQIPSLVPISLADLERFEPELAKVAKNRKKSEFCFTCTPCLPLYILEHYSEVDLITYLDADLFFFSDPSPLYREMAGQSIMIIPHHYAHDPQMQERLYGIYNVGWVSFRRDPEALNCLQRWKEQCLESCPDMPRDGKYGDQKYMDEWPRRYRHIAILKNRGANLAPWNVEGCKVEEKNGNLMVNGESIVFFHFSALRRVKSWIYTHGFSKSRRMPSRFIKMRIYAPYLETLKAIDDEEKKPVFTLSPKALVKNGKYFDLSACFTLGQRELKSFLSVLMKMLKGKCVFVWKRAVLSRK